ncbi:MAG: 4-(cytidine 5'-diphospho)-2-C-methyl-D-erythritol kinase [Vicinamibacterales bacterium]
MTAPSGTSVRVRACAKINLTLRVLGIHPDGYHELRTTFQSLALHDTLTVTRTRGPFAITSDAPDCPLDESNLVWKAARRVWAAAGRRGEPARVHVHIRKRIPVQAGLGGGSSDGAAALKALRLLWMPRMDDADLVGIGRDLGADVVFFLQGGTALGVERGDLLFPLQDTEPVWVVLARPGFGVSTADAYRWWDEAFTAAGRPPAIGRGPGGEWTNDLQAPVVARHPEIGRLIARLDTAGAHFAAMSGSGSAVFGLFRDRVQADAAVRTLRAPQVTTWLTRTVDRRRYGRATAPVFV